MHEKAQQPSRKLELAGGINFRDLGGYPSHNGKTVAWRKLLRSGHMANLTEADKQHLADLQLGQIHDFRNQQEQRQFPNQVKEVSQHRDYQFKFGSLGEFFELAVQGDITEIKSRSLMEESYEYAAYGVSAELGRFVKTVAASEKDVFVFHCMAGKDRTGLAAAVLLMALDVPESIIVEDYLLTLRYSEVDWMLELLVNDLKSRGAKRIREAAILPYCTVDESYIASFLQKVKQSFKSYRDYLQQGLGVTVSELDRLQQIYLEG